MRLIVYKNILENHEKNNQLLNIPFSFNIE